MKSRIGPETEELYCFYCMMLNFERKLPKWALCTDRHPLKETLTHCDPYRPMGECQNLALYYNNVYYLSQPVTGYNRHIPLNYFQISE